MTKIILTTIFSFLIASYNIAQVNYIATQPKEGPGSPNYKHSKVSKIDKSENPDGYWLYQPASPVPDSAEVIVFMHGYGAYNPMIYGKWIKHLVLQGNIVIFPRYQKNLISPAPSKFTANSSKGIRDALDFLKQKNEIHAITKNLSFASHSYGGVIAANLAVNFESHNIPQPKAIMLCSPGSGPFKGGVLDSYEAIPSNVKMLVMVTHNDHVVGDEFGIQVFETATNVPQRNFIRQYRDHSINPPIQAGHNECYALDKDFDNGKNNRTTNRAVRISRENNVDYYGYWKLFDALLDCTRNGSNCEYAFGNTPEQISLGTKPNGQLIRSLDVTLPKEQVISKLANKTKKD